MISMIRQVFFSVYGTSVQHDPIVSYLPHPYRTHLTLKHHLDVVIFQKPRLGVRAFFFSMYSP